VAGPDPWAGHTLEWAAPSPPPIHNFDALPEIRSATPLLDLRRAQYLSEARAGAGADRGREGAPDA
jgi:cytochrome c oxidase subunit 1